MMRRFDLTSTLAAARRDGVDARLPDAPRLTRRVTVHTRAELNAALGVAGSDITLGPKLTLGGEMHVRASDIRVSGPQAVALNPRGIDLRVPPIVGGSSGVAATIWIDQEVQRIAIENLTAARIVWQAPHRFDDSLGQPVTNPALQASNVALRNLTLTGQRGESTLIIHGNRTLIHNCLITSPDQFCLWGASSSPLVASKANPVPFGITDLIVVGCTLTNTGSGQANLRVHNCLRHAGA